MRQEIEQLDANRLLNTSPIDLATYLLQKYTLQAPSLRRDDWSASEHEAQIDVRNDANRWITDRSRPCYIPGQRIEVEVPIEGEVELLYARASTFSSSPPRANIRGRSLILEFKVPHDEPQRDIREEIDRTLAEIDQHLSWVKSDLYGFNGGLQHTADEAIAARRQRILSNQGRIAALGIPLKSRPDAPKTYASPEVRRKVTPALPTATSSPFEPEPVLDMENYNHILSVIQNMAQVMERSPSAFKGMGEEDLRQHFLVQLNGHFEGAATGETFNVNGKTDILLRANVQTLFTMKQTYQGSCHCGKIRFEIDTDLDHVRICDCSICRKRGALIHRVPPECFRLLTPMSELLLYQWHTKVAKDYFCSTCGILPFRRPRTTEDVWGVNVRCLDGVDFASIPVKSIYGSRLD